MAAKHSGQLELTWTDKDKALLSVSDGRYDYTFVDPADYRVNEVRLLDEVARYEAPVPDDRPGDLPAPTTDNLLITGDAMHALDALRVLPEYADRYVGQVKLCYIDPPFNTGKLFDSYEDNIEHSIWLTMLRDRLQQIKPLLAGDGSVWVHLDDTEVHRCRAVLDEIMGADHFIAEVVWQKADSTRNDSGRISDDHDTLLVYRSSREWVPQKLRRTAESDARFDSPDGDPTPWFDDNPTAPGARTHQGMVYAIQHPITGVLHYPARGRCWWTEQSQILSFMNEYAKYELRSINDEEHRADLCGVDMAAVRQDVHAVMLAVPLEESATSARQRLERGHFPMIILRSGGEGGLGRKSYVPASGLVPSTWWDNAEVGHNREAKAEIKALFPESNVFATPKPERLIQRIIHISTNPGDTVLDCFAGSGTTAAVAHKMGRKWVTSELSPHNVETYTKPRLLKVVKGEDGGGVTTETERVEADGVTLPSGVSPKQAQSFTTSVKKFGDQLDYPIDVAQATAKAVRAQARSGTSPLDDGERRELLRLLRKVSASESEGLIVNVMPEAVKSLRRAAKTRDVTTLKWHGGGGFTHLRVHVSMFEELDGEVYLADWATNGALTKAMCAQLGLSHRPDGIFAGRKGRVRYVVLDGMVTTSTVDAILEQLGEDEIVEVWATQVDPYAAEALRKCRIGSRLSTIPASVLDSYRRKAATTSPFKHASEDGESGNA